MEFFGQTTVGMCGPSNFGQVVLHQYCQTRIRQEMHKRLTLTNDNSYVIPWIFDKFTRMLDNLLVKQRKPLFEFSTAFLMQVQFFKSLTQFVF